MHMVPTNYYYNDYLQCLERMVVPEHRLFIAFWTKIFQLPGEIGFISRLGLVTGFLEQELLYIKEKPDINKINTL